MSDLDQLLADIARGPSGPEVGAFFDFDGTLIAGYSAGAIYRDRLRRLDVSFGELGRSLWAALDMSLRGSDVTRLMRVAVESLAGRAEDELEELGERLFVQRIAAMVYPEARLLLRAHLRMGHTVAVASSATPFQTYPAARDLGVEHVLCTRVRVEDGLLTGEVDGAVLWGEGKADAVREFAAEHEVDLRSSFAYANGDEDLPFLEAVGRPRTLNPAAGLAKMARERGWPVRRFRQRGGTELTPIVRTGAALTGLGAAIATGIGIGLLNRSRRQAANLVTSVGADLALALGGVQLRVQGGENLWSHRPAVFIFNHQSSIDMLVIASLVREDVTGVAKKEAARDPRFAMIGLLADVAYVDRGNTRQARAALTPVVEKLRSGISIAIAPEGTRSPTPRVGPFKKGAFHIALQAGVPIVPIVVRNAGEVMWRNSLLLRPGTIEVAVLEPIPTEGWAAREIDEHVAEVRERFVQTLEDWPVPRALASGAESRSAAGESADLQPVGEQ